MKGAQRFAATLALLATLFAGPAVGLAADSASSAAEAQLWLAQHYNDGRHDGRCHHVCQREHDRHAEWCRENRRGHHLRNCLEKVRHQLHSCQRSCR